MRVVDRFPDRATKFHVSPPVFPRGICAIEKAAVTGQRELRKKKEKKRKEWRS